MIKVRIDVDISEAMNKMEEMKARSLNFTPALIKARKRLEAYNEENFSTGGLPVGGWRPRKDDGNWPLMDKSGKLKKSLTSLVGPANIIAATSAQFGTSVKYAEYHQNGTFSMTARRIVFEPRGFAKEVGNDAAEHITGMGRYFS